MKNKIIISAALSALILCSCGESTSGEADFTESDIALQTEETEASQFFRINEAETTFQEEETVTSETTLKKANYDMIPLLERPTYKEPQYAAISENTEFTVELKDISPETDLFVLTNMEKHSPGNTFKMDLDGDGVEEEISVEEDFYDCEGKLRVLRVIIGGKTYNLDRSHDKFANVPTGIFTCDIDSSDNYIEIVCAGSTATNDYLTKFYRYENGELRRIFDISYDTPDGQGESEMFIDEMNSSVTGKPIITDGSGVITAARRLDSQTWLAYSHYSYDSGSGEISLICEPVYPYYYENINNFAAAEEFTSEFYSIAGRPLSYSQKEVELYAEPDLNSETVTLAPQRIYFTAEYPFLSEDQHIGGMWIYIIAEDGTSGWFCFDVNKSDELITDIFSLLVLYD